jgi:ATP-dependent exoDNAse (exonuclease V) beta subunit
VRLAEDFPPAPKAEELRLLYVAVTRARLRLDVTAVGYLADDEAEDTDEQPEPGLFAAAAYMAIPLDHDDLGHDHADCAECIAEAREADRAADAASCGLRLPAGVEPSERFTLHRRDRRTGQVSAVPMEDETLAVRTAHANYRSGLYSQVAVYDRSGELVVALEA